MPITSPGMRVTPVELKLKACLVETEGNCLHCSRNIKAGTIGTIDSEAGRVVCWACTGRAVAKQVQASTVPKIIV